MIATTMTARRRWWRWTTTTRRRRHPPLLLLLLPTLLLLGGSTHPVPPRCRRWGGGDAWRRRRRRLGRRGGAAQVEAGRWQRQRRRRRCDGGVWIDNFIPSLFSVDIIIFTSTKSEHSDSPWCEPITPLFSEVRLSEAKKHACGRTIILGGEDRRQSTNYVLSSTNYRCLWTGPNSP